MSFTSSTWVCAAAVAAPGQNTLGRHSLFLFPELQMTQITQNGGNSPIVLFHNIFFLPPFSAPLRDVLAVWEHPPVHIHWILLQAFLSCDSLKKGCESFPSCLPGLSLHHLTLMNALQQTVCLSCMVESGNNCLLQHLLLSVNNLV